MSSIKKDIIIRFAIVYLLIVIGFGLVVYKIVIIQYVEGSKWKELSKQNKKEDIIVFAYRGNIYSSEGKLIASSIPYYKLFIDFSVESLKSDTLNKHIDSLAYCLSRKLRDKSESAYRNDILRAYRKKNVNGRRNTRYQIYPKEVSFVDLEEIREFPLFRKGKYKSGFYTEERMIRVRPFGSLASRTIGDIYKSSGAGRSGIEKHCNDILTGENGVCTRKKIAGERIAINEVDPIHGIDIITTINVDMQDIAEKALRKELNRFQADEGCAVLMEVKTGEVKAISNLTRANDGNYYESKNMAVGSIREPGSTFKVASMIVALEDGFVKPTDTIDTGNGKHLFFGTEMKDHNHTKGGYGKLTISQVIENSSNVGMSRIIEENYGKNPEKFVNRLYAMKMNEPVELDIPGAGKPYIPHPKDQNISWDKTKLPWMSIGYNINMPPIYTLMFFNAIANNGKMIKPFFVKNYSKNGAITKTFSTETICPSICSASTLKQIKPMLEAVVTKGTAKDAKSNSFTIAGKTGTSLINYGNKQEILKYQVSFCGYFPAEKPQYSCIVVIFGPKTVNPSGGQMAGTVFKEIAEKIYARNATISPNDIETDSTLLKTPISKNGKYEDLNNVFSKLDISVSGKSNKSNFVKTNTYESEVKVMNINTDNGLIPNVLGMGAQDAVYLIERLGMRVQLIGKGSVSSQSIGAGNKPVKGQTISLILR